MDDVEPESKPKEIDGGGARRKGGTKVIGNEEKRVEEGASPLEGEEREAAMGKNWRQQG